MRARFVSHSPLEENYLRFSRVPYPLLPWNICYVYSVACSHTLVKSGEGHTPISFMALPVEFWGSQSLCPNMLCPGDLCRYLKGSPVDLVVMSLLKCVIFSQRDIIRGFYIAY